MTNTASIADDALKSITTHHEPTRHTTIAEVANLATLPVWSDREPSAAGLLGVGRTNAYALAKSGDIPTLKLGRRVVVPVASLLRLLGVEA